MQLIKEEEEEKHPCWINGTHMLRIREWVSKICFSTLRQTTTQSGPNFCSESSRIVGHS